VSSGRRWVRPLLAVAAAIGTAVSAYVATALLAFGLTPTCASTDPPGPLDLDLALLVTAVVAGAVPMLAAGRDRSMRYWRWLLAAVAAAPPAIALGIVFTRPVSGFCF
jgi:hypothetical protein